MFLLTWVSKNVCLPSLPSQKLIRWMSGTGSIQWGGNSHVQMWHNEMREIQLELRDGDGWGEAGMQ